MGVSMASCNTLTIDWILILLFRVGKVLRAALAMAGLLVPLRFAPEYGNVDMIPRLSPNITYNFEAPLYSYGSTKTLYSFHHPSLPEPLTTLHASTAETRMHRDANYTPVHIPTRQRHEVTLFNIAIGVLCSHRLLDSPSYSAQ